MFEHAAAWIASLSMWDKSHSESKLFPGSLSIILLLTLVTSVAFCLLSSTLTKPYSWPRWDTRSDVACVQNCSAMYEPKWDSGWWTWN